MAKVHFQRLVPSEEVGEYCSYEEKKTGYLYPLREEGEYGPLPTYKYPGKWTSPGKYEKRPRKPKVYASYAVSSECALHAPKLGKYERNIRPGAGRSNRANSAPPSFKPNPDSSSSARRPVRYTSLPPLEYGDYQEECELISQLSVSRDISADKEESLLDRSADSEADVEGNAEERVNLERSGEEGGLLGLSTRLMSEQRKSSETFMSSTETFLREEPLTTYVV